MDGLLLVTSSSQSGLEPFQKWALVIAAVLTIVYAVMRPMRRRKDPLTTRKPVSLAGQREVEKQMTDLIVELEKMARQMTAQLDTRAARLEALLREADERIATLRTLAEAGAGAGRFRLLAAPEPAAPEAEDMPDPRHMEIYELAQKGHSAHQIAQRLGRPYGEIELILALRGHERGERQFIAS
jgi:propanediol dehydratase small subunit